MFFEEIIHSKGTYYLGIAEVKNERHATMKELVHHATSVSKDMLAVQLLNGSMIVDVHHLVSATQNAINAWTNDYSKARSLDIEIVVFASGQKQIGHALETFGVTDGLERIAIVVVGAIKDQVQHCLDSLIAKIGVPFETPFPSDQARFSYIMQYFGIEHEEISTLLSSETSLKLQEALSRCVVSRVSLVALES